jgi:hypothetical protein
MTRSIEQIGGGDRRLTVVELGEAELGVGIEEGLLVDPPDALESSDVEGVLSAAVAGAFGIELTVGFLVGLGLLQGGELAFCEDQSLLRHFSFEGFEAELHGGEVVAQPDATDPEGRDTDAAPERFVGDPCLAPGRLVDGDGDYGLLDFRGGTVLEDGLAAGELLKGEFAAFFVEFLEAIEAVAGISVPSTDIISTFVTPDQRHSLGSGHPPWRAHMRHTLRPRGVSFRPVDTRDQ